MKFSLIVLTVFISLACEAKKEKTLPVKKNVSPVLSKEAQKALETKKTEPPCDEKEKKPVEIKPESFSLNSGTGCTLDEAK